MERVCARSITRCLRGALIIVAALFLPFFTPVAQASDQTVNNCSNEAELRSDWNAMQSSGGGTLTFNCGTASIVLTGGALSTSLALADAIVDGGGLITLSGGNATRLFIVNTNRTLTLRNITLTLGDASGGGSAGDGGCIWSQGTLNLDNTIVERCHASNDGGGILSYTGGHVTISNNSTIRNNVAERDCGGICEFGVSLVLNNALIDGNRAVTRYAGGIGGVNLILVANSTVSNNTAGLDGGGIFNNDQLTVQNSVFAGNSSTNGYGGGIINDGGTVTIVESRLSTNSAGVGGGAIANREGPSAPQLNLNNVTVTNNSTASEGGGIINFFNGNLIVNNSRFSGNSSLRTGGGITNRGVMTLTNVTLSGNSASNAGGGLENFYATQTLNYVTLAGNTSPFGGGIFHAGGDSSHTSSLRNTIIANSSTGGNCYTDAFSVTPIASNGFNLSSDTSCATSFTQLSDWNNTHPYLGTLRDNGGPTLTHMIFPPSKAIDNGQCSSASDQRGVTRPVGLSCDIGAVEYQPFTDNPSTPGVTVIRAVHITELRTRIDRLRAYYSIAAFSWSDSSLAAGVTPVRAQHIVDLRTALAAAYGAAGLTPPAYSDPGLTAGTTAKAVHIAQLRAAVIVIEQQ